jgi:S1-C subfamily serine protease
MRNQQNILAMGKMLFVVISSLAIQLAGFAQTNSSPSSQAQSPSQGPGQITKPNPVVAASTPAENKPDVAQDSVVKVFSTELYPNPYQPWNKGTPTEITGSGVVIEGHRIITNAHVVLYGSQYQIQGSQSGDKISATVEAIAPGIDLAVLKLDDEKFFDTHPPLSRGVALPQVKEPVMVYGYPKGGDTLSITKGIVSRIEFTSYYFNVAGLRIQIDAAINPGNSGGAAVVDGKMIGMAFSHLGDSENIGYIIPSEEIELFLRNIANGAYHKKPAIFDEFQTLENPALRSFLKIDNSVEGVIVKKPLNSDPAYPLKQWDVVTKIGGTPVDDQGMIKLGENLHVAFNYLVQKVAKDGKVPLTVIRGGKEVQIELPVSTDRPLVIPYLNDSYPSYFIYGSLVFSNASREFLGDFMGTAKAATILSGLIEKESPLINREADKPAFDGERLVIVSSPFFPNKLSKGYGNPMSSVVKSVNNIPIQNIEHLVKVLRDSKDDFITIEFYGHYGETLVFRRTEMLAATDEVLTNNGIRSQGSPDALAIWNAKPVQ